MILAENEQLNCINKIYFGTIEGAKSLIVKFFSFWKKELVGKIGICIAKFSEGVSDESFFGNLCNTAFFTACIESGTKIVEPMIWKNSSHFIAHVF